jgi:voltage-gated potassium channel
MRNLQPDSPPTLDQERSEILQQLDNWLETPMLVLGITWLGLFVVDLVWGLTPLL